MVFEDGKLPWSSCPGGYQLGIDRSSVLVAVVNYSRSKERETVTIFLEAHGKSDIVERVFSCPLKPPHTPHETFFGL